MSEFSDELLELWFGVKILQIVVGQQVIGVFVPPIDSFLEILQSFIETVGRRRHAGVGIPYREGVPLPLGVAFLLDHVAKQLAGLGVALTLGKRCPEALEGIQGFGMLWPERAKPDFESLTSNLFCLRIASFPNQNFGKV